MSNSEINPVIAAFINNAGRKVVDSSPVTTNETVEKKALNLRYTHFRPCHAIGKYLLHSPATDAAKRVVTEKLGRYVNNVSNAATVEQLEQALIQAGHGMHVSSPRGGSGKHDRMSTLIWNLTADPNHGGSEIFTIKSGRTVLGYKLMTPERMNEFGQNVVTRAQVLADQKAHAKMPEATKVEEVPVRQRSRRNMPEQVGAPTLILPPTSTTRERLVWSKDGFVDPKQATS